MRRFFTGIALLVIFHTLILRAADEATQNWGWNEQAADVMHSVMHADPHYDITVERKAEPELKGISKKLEITIKAGDRIAWQWTATRNCVFVIDAEKLYYAVLPNDTAADVSCVDLTTGKVVWTSSIKGLKVNYFQNVNLLNITVFNHIVQIHSNQAIGRFIENLDAESGKSTWYVQYPPDGHSLPTLLR